MNKQIAVVTLLIAIAVITTAYEFNDPVFNQILADDLKELESFDQVHHRSRRDDEAGHPDKCRPPFRRRKMCCADETMEEQHEKDKELKRECFKKLTGKDKEGRGGEFDPFRCDRVDKHRKEMTCVIQCVGQKKDMVSTVQGLYCETKSFVSCLLLKSRLRLEKSHEPVWKYTSDTHHFFEAPVIIVCVISQLDKDGNPKEAEFTAFVKETMAKESWFASIQDKVIPACLAEARNATANRDTSDTESCNPAGAKLLHCLFREIQLGCPAEQIKDQKACTRAREKIKRNNDIFPGPPPFHHDD
ncbi:hypothetical protein GEV33_012222 [Tenebrio molitor]|uniref:Uncharacterized protein n=1 Tax=Tenebrio molitor TaxID=7067 RepID=A0A8J6H974_TENMO|nr:hypothetical protein GEV33_012222 [Tenebrio molitor]